MNDDPASPNAPRPGLPAESLEAARDRFAAAWRSGQRPRIEDYLGHDDSAARRCELLAALVGIDLEYRWRPAAPHPADDALPDADAEQPARGSDSLPVRPRLEDYLARFPALGPPQEISLDLIVEEYRVRHRWGDRPGHAEYFDRFGRRHQLSEMLWRTDGELASGETIGHTALLDSRWSGQPGTSSGGRGPRRRLGDYELSERLGHGGMGVVYKARHVLLNQIVALKVLPERYLDEPQAVSRFRREMQLIGGLNHPNIVQAHNAGEQQGVHYLVMEYVDGITLEQLVFLCGDPLPVGAACELVRQAALGLQHAHLHGLIHRDVKPANLMLSSGGTLKVLDLGLARLRADLQSTGQLTEYGVSEPGIAIGTVDYMAPEQWEDSSGVDIRADVYSLGCTLFYLLTGRAPYGQPAFDTIRKKLKAHAAEPVPSLAEHRGDCPKELDKLLGRMLAKEPEDRFDTPAEVAEQLQRLADFDELLELLPANIVTGEQSGAVSDAAVAGSDVDTWKKRSRSPGSRMRQSSRQVPKPWYRRRPLVWGLVALAALAVGVALWRIPSSWRQQLRDELGCAPGLKGGWWFDETPWLVPAVRARLIEAIDRREREIAGVSLENLAAMTRGSDVDELYAELYKLADELKTRIPDQRERALVAKVQALLSDRDQVSPESYRGKLVRVKKTLDEVLQVDTPTALHYKAVVQHELARYELAEWSDARASYQAALAGYQQSGEGHAGILRTLCTADYSQMLFDSRDYQDSVSYFQEARRNVEVPALVVATLCQEADASRKLRPIPNLAHANRCLDEAQRSGGLPDDHPLQAHVLQRRAWVQMDSWQFSGAIESFSRSLAIRAKHAGGDDARTSTFALWSRQGIAMANHFLAEEEKVTAGFEELLDDVPDASRPAGSQQRRRSERGPNVYECYADWFLFGTRPDYRQAADYLDRGIKQAEYLHFDEDYRAPYVLRLRWKRRLAEALAPPSAAAGPNGDPNGDPSRQPVGIEASTEDDQDRDSEIFAEARRVALDVALLQEAVQQGNRADLEPLLQKVNDARPGTQLARNKIGLLLLAIERVCDSRMVRPDQLRVVARQLIEIANVTSLGEDRGIRKFLRRYFLAVQRELDRIGEDTGGVDLTTERELIAEWLR